MLRMCCSAPPVLLALVVVLGPLPAQQTGKSIGEIESLIRTRQYAEALQSTQSSLRNSPNDFRLWTLEGIVLSLQGDANGAISAFDKALRISPDYPPALKGQVQLLYPKNDARAVPLLERILKANPQDITAHEMLATIEKARGDCKDSVEHFRLSGEATNSHPASLEAYGYCLTQLNRYEDAIPVFQRLVDRLPDRAYAKYDLAVVLVVAKQNNEAVKVLEPLLTADQQDPDILSLASQAYEAIGNTPKAVALLRQAIVLSPTTPGYYVSFATMCLDHDSFQVGIDMINAGLQRIQNDPSLYLSRGLLYAQLSDYAKAEADFSRVDQLDAGQALSSYAKDLADVERNNPDKALLNVRSQLKAHPDSPELHFLLARLLSDRNADPDSADFKEAVSSAKAALALRPAMVDARDLLGGLYIHAEQYNLAIEQSRLAIKQSPSDETAAYHLLVALRHTGQSGTDEMKALVKRLAEMHQESLKRETERKKFRLVEQSNASPAQAGP